VGFDFHRSVQNIAKQIKKRIRRSLLISDNHKQVVRVESLKAVGDQLEFLSRANELQRKEVAAAKFGNFTQHKSIT
jgi:hypothetical protein